VAGACALIGPLALIGSLVGALATIPLTMWAYLCRDCPAMRALLVAGVGAFDVLAIAALVSSATGADSCSAGFLGGALIVSGAVFSLAVPYLLLCVTGCDGLRVTFGVMAGVYGALLLTALVFVLLGMLEVSVVLVFVAAFVAAVALNLVLLPILFLCSDD
jgi:hypothetical protein